MEDTIIKATVNGGIALLTLALIGLFVVRWLIPFIERALSAHTKTIETVVTSHEARQTQLVESFRDTNETLTKAHHNTVEMLASGVGRDVSAIRGDMDRIADVLAGAGIETTGRTRKATPAWPVRERGEAQAPRDQRGRATDRYPEREAPREPSQRRSGIRPAPVSSETPTEPGDSSDSNPAKR